MSSQQKKNKLLGMDLNILNATARQKSFLKSFKNHS